jgi:hypothetical protein
MQMHKILTVWTSTGNLKYTWHDTFLWTEDSYHSHENRVFILYFGFIHNEHKVNTRSTNHTSPKEQKHGTLTCLNCKYTIQILHVTQGSRGHIIQGVEMYNWMISENLTYLVLSFESWAEHKIWKWKCQYECTGCFNIKTNQHVCLKSLVASLASGIDCSRT